MLSQDWLELGCYVYFHFQTIAHARENGVPEEALEMLMTLWTQKLKLSPSQLDEELMAKHDQEDADADDEEDEVHSSMKIKLKLFTRMYYPFSIIESNGSS